MRTRRDPTREVVENPLPGLKKQLEIEYADVPDQKVEEVAKHALELEEFEGARVREFVPILAWRHAREHLRQAS